jgi:hypothetical protein
MRSRNRVLTVVNGFPESDPDIEHSQPADYSSHKPIGDNRTEPRVTQQEPIVRPLGMPRKDYKQHSHPGAHEHEYQYQDPVHPEIQQLRFDPIAISRRAAVTRGRTDIAGFKRFGRPVLQRSLRVRNHAFFPVARRELTCEAAMGRRPAPSPGCALGHIPTFYDFNALMRSATSR